MSQGTSNREQLMTVPEKTGIEQTFGYKIPTPLVPFVSVGPGTRGGCDRGKTPPKTQDLRSRPHTTIVGDGTTSVSGRGRVRRRT